MTRGPADTPPPPLPRALEERYRVVRTLGRGGFGVVLEAEDRTLARRVALKLLQADLADGEVLRRFEREARLTAALRHPHVVRLYAHGVDEGQAWIAYELVTGGTLGQRLRAAGPQAPEQVLRWGRQAADALQAAHEAGVVHRDVKPENLLLRESGELVLADFGIARSSRTGTMVTPDGLVLGTPASMAPELLLGELPTPASDQFALAASLYHLATGESVYRAVDVAGVLEAVRHGWSGVAPAGIPAELRGPLVRGLAPAPADRFASLEAMRVGLGAPPDPAAAATRRLPAPRSEGPATEPVQAAAPAAARRPAPRVLAAAGLVLVALVRWAWRPPAEVATPPGPTRVPKAAPWGEVLAQLAALGRTHRGPQGGLANPDDAHARSLAAEVLDPGYVWGIHRLTQALGRWLEASAGMPGGPPLRTPRSVRRGSEVLELLDHLLLDRLRLEGDLTRTIQDPLEVQRDWKSLAARRRDFEDGTLRLSASVRGLLDLWARLDPEGQDAVRLAYQGMLRGRLELGGAGAVLEALRRRAPVAPPLVRPMLAHALRTLLESTRTTREIRIGTRLEAARAPAGWSPDETTPAYFQVYFHLCWANPRETTALDVASMGRYLDTLEATRDRGGSAAVAHTLLRLTDQERQWRGDRGLATEPAWTATLERLRRLRQSLEGGAGATGP